MATAELVVISKVGNKFLLFEYKGQDSTNGNGGNTAPIPIVNNGAWSLDNHISVKGNTAFVISRNKHQDAVF